MSTTAGGPPSTGSFNATYAVMMATSTIPFLYYIDSDIPHNHGVLQHISANAADNTICLAKWPAAVAGATQNPADPHARGHQYRHGRGHPRARAGRWGAYRPHPELQRRGYQNR